MWIQKAERSIFKNCLTVGIFLTILWSQCNLWANDRGCLSCHDGIESIGPYHKLPCTGCHGGDGKGRSKRDAHRGMVSNPSDLKNAEVRCGPCHREEVRNVQRSLMVTASGIINTTRFLWGAQATPDAIYSASFHGPIPVVPDYMDSGNLVDDLLRKKCLRCHLNAQGPLRKGEYRSTGCAACHVVYGNDGMSESGDRAIKELMISARQGKKLLNRGYPLKHQLTRMIPTAQCNHCHNSNRVGADYIGLFERDYDENYRFLSRDRKEVEFIYGMDHHRLIPDIHYERGLACIDCHTKKEVMGDGLLRGRSFEQVKVRCERCHGNHDKAPESDVSELSNLIGKGGDLFLRGKVTGRLHRVPVLYGMGKIPLAHAIPGHMKRMECYSCHCAWTFQDYGLHLIREDYANYGRWQHLWAQNDPQIQEILILARSSRNRTPSPLMKDWLTGKRSIGIWYFGWSYRRWEDPVFGINARGKTSPLRPDYQYIISHVTADRLVQMDSIIPVSGNGKIGWAMNPYVPHTTRKEVRKCEGCHLNPKALGLGNSIIIRENGRRIRLLPLTFPSRDGLKVNFQLEQITDMDGNRYQCQTHPGARPYNPEELIRLLSKTSRYKKYRLEEFGSRATVLK